MSNIEETRCPFVTVYCARTFSEAMEAGGGDEQGEAHRVKTEVRDALVGKINK